MIIDLTPMMDTMQVHRPQVYDEQSGIHAGANTDQLIFWLNERDFTLVPNYTGADGASYATEVKRFVRENLVKAIVLELVNQNFPKSAARILELSHLEDFEDGAQPMSLTSAIGYVQFVDKFLTEKFNGLGEPLLGILSTGALSASWHLAKDQCLVVDFLGNERVSFALLDANQNAPDSLIDDSEDSIAQTGLAERLIAHGVDKWRKT